MKQNVVVIGKNYLTTLGVVRSLAKAGMAPDVVFVTAKDADAKIVAASAGAGRMTVIGERDEDTVVRTLLEQYPEGAVLLPTDDFSASCLDRHAAELGEAYPMPRIADGSVTEMMDKTVQSRIAREAGLQTAREWVVPLDTDRLSVPEDVVYPCFVKPLLSAKGGKAGLYRCGDAAELKSRLLGMQSRMRERSVLVQEFLNITREYTMGGVCRDQEILLPGVIRKTRIARHNRGVTLAGVMEDESGIREVYPAVIRFLKVVRFTGLFDLELLQTDRGFFFGELNLRCGGPGYAYLRCGVNLPEAAVRAIRGEEIPGGKVTAGKAFVNDKVAWEDYADLLLTGKEMRRLYAESDFSLLGDPEDPGPEKAFRELREPVYRKAAAKKRIAKILRPVLGAVRGKKS